MSRNLVVPVGHLPIDAGQVGGPAGRAGESPLAAAQRQLEETESALEGTGAPAPRRRDGDARSGLGRADQKREPGGEGQGDQQAFEMVAVHHRPLLQLPVPAGGFEIAQAGLNRAAPVRERQQRPTRRPITDQGERPRMAGALRDAGDTCRPGGESGRAKRLPGQPGNRQPHRQRRDPRHEKRLDPLPEPVVFERPLAGPIAQTRGSARPRYPTATVKSTTRLSRGVGSRSKRPARGRPNWREARLRRG